MKKLQYSFALAAFGLVSSMANAQFSITAAGPVGSNGVLDDPGNAHLTGTYTGATTIFGNFSFSGTITSVISTTWETEAMWVIGNASKGAGYELRPSDNLNTFTSDQVSFSQSGMVFMAHNDSIDLQAFEDFDDGTGADSNWTNLNFTWSGSASLTSLGNFAHGSSFDFDTFASDYDTMLGLYDSTGTLIGFNDDASGLQSEINQGVLADGTYYLAAAGFGNAGFGNGFGLGGNDFGSLNLKLNGNSVFSGATTSYNAKSFTFTVGNPVPEPASMAAIGLGAIALIRRRRKA